MKAVVIVVEGVGATMLGPYGSSTSATPALNRLAASGLLLDQCAIDSFDVSRQVRSLWTSQHANTRAEPGWNIWRAWQQAGVPAQLITDSPLVAELAAEFDVPQVTLVNVHAADVAADTAEECNLSQLFAAAMDVMASEETAGVVWIHSQGLRHAWDAPLELREAMIDPEDPIPPAEVYFPEIELNEDSDPDVALGWSQVAAAQVAVLDESIDALDQTIAARADKDEWTWLFCSLGGIPLGEHGTIGLAQQVGYVEEVASAAIIRPARLHLVGARRAELCQLPDLPTTLLDAMGLPAPALAWGRTLLVAGPPLATTQWPDAHRIAYLETREHVWLRTPAWSLLLRGGLDDGYEENCELYVKPDDRWEVTNIADRGTDIVEQLQELLPAVRHAFAVGDRQQLPTIPEELVSLLRN